MEDNLLFISNKIESSTIDKSEFGRIKELFERFCDRGGDKYIY